MTADELADDPNAEINGVPLTQADRDALRLSARQARERGEISPAKARRLATLLTPNGEQRPA